MFHHRNALKGLDFFGWDCVHCFGNLITEGVKRDRLFAYIVISFMKRKAGQKMRAIKVSKKWNHFLRQTQILIWKLLCSYACELNCFCHDFWLLFKKCCWFIACRGVMLHYNDVIMSAMASQITRLTIVYSTVYSGADHRKYKSSTSLDSNA